MIKDLIPVNVSGWYSQDYDGRIHWFSDKPFKHRQSNRSMLWIGEGKRHILTENRCSSWHNVVYYVEEGEVTKVPVVEEIQALPEKPRSFKEMPLDYKKAQAYTNKARNAMDRNINFELSFEEFSAIYDTPVCCISGVKLIHGESPQSRHAHSIDRLDPQIGYVKGNVVAMSGKINHHKGELDKFLSSGLPDEELLKVIYKVEYVLRKRIKAKAEKETA